MWVIGGAAGPPPPGENDVWYSRDGTNWTAATRSAPWSGRTGHTSVVFDNKIWVIGGVDSTGAGMNDVWYSSDGVNWRRACYAADWHLRAGHTSVVFDGKIWVIGGYYFERKSYLLNDVWYSSDGKNWSRATFSAPWSPRHSHTSVVHDNKIWVIGGFDTTAPGKCDVWYSSDGASWRQATASAAWGQRVYHSSVAFNGRIWVMGGVLVEGLNDVWYSNYLTAARNWWRY